VIVVICLTVLCIAHFSNLGLSGILSAVSLLVVRACYAVQICNPMILSFETSPLMFSLLTWCNVCMVTTSTDMHLLVATNWQVVLMLWTSLFVDNFLLAYPCSWSLNWSVACIYIVQFRTNFVHYTAVCFKSICPTCCNIWVMQSIPDNPAYLLAILFYVFVSVAVYNFSLFCLQSSLVCMGVWHNPCLSVWLPICNKN
jgi:hypothetical protein